MVRYVQTDSRLVSLRVRLYLELARCDMEQDFLAKAVDSVKKALALDYGTVKAENLYEDTRDSQERPLDRYLRALQQDLALRTSLYSEPDNAEDRVVLLLDKVSAGQRRSSSASV